jgi:hypothetical protein
METFILFHFRRYFLLPTLAYAGLVFVYTLYLIGCSLTIHVEYEKPLVSLLAEMAFFGSLFISVFGFGVIFFIWVSKFQNFLENFLKLLKLETDSPDLVMDRDQKISSKFNPFNLAMQNFDQFKAGIHTELLNSNKRIITFEQSNPKAYSKAQVGILHRQILNHLSRSPYKTFTSPQANFHRLRDSSLALIFILSQKIWFCLSIGMLWFSWGNHLYNEYNLWVALGLLAMGSFTSFILIKPLTQTLKSINYIFAHCGITPTHQAVILESIQPVPLRNHLLSLWQDSAALVQKIIDLNALLDKENKFTPPLMVDVEFEHDSQRRDL